MPEQEQAKSSILSEIKAISNKKQQTLNDIRISLADCIRSIDDLF